MMLGVTTAADGSGADHVGLVLAGTFATPVNSLALEPVNAPMTAEHEHGDQRR